MEQLIQTLKEQLIKSLNLEETSPEEIDASAPLFGEGLGLDSIDALEIILILEKNYGIKLENPAAAKPIFYSVRTLAEFIKENRTK
jgi:acyl carrier protein